MTDKIIRKFEPEEAALKRLEYIESVVIPPVRAAFTDFPELKSATLMVAQYWCDEAHDAVHSNLVYSLSDRPDVDKQRSELERAANGEDIHNDYESPENEYTALTYFVEGLEVTRILGDRAALITSWESQQKYMLWQEWDSNNDAIPLFAAFCVEGGHQEGYELEFSTPCVILRRGENDTVTIEVLPDMPRPWMDGVRPEWEAIAEQNQMKMVETDRVSTKPIAPQKRSLLSLLFGKK